MAKIEDCPGFETFGADVKAARKAKQLSRSALADMIHCDSRYLANIENEGTLPSLPVVIQLIKICGLPWSGTSTRNLCGKKVQSVSGSATSCSFARKNTCPS